MSTEKEFDFDSPRQANLIPTGDGERYYKLLRLQDALEHSWEADTCAEWERGKWSPCLPAFGQCAVTALIVQDFVGGRMVKDPENDHYWNVMDDGTEVDLTRAQFAEGIVLKATEERTREYMLTGERSIKAKTPDRYKILRERVRNILGE
jgi:hypothetical protein